MVNVTVREHRCRSCGAAGRPDAPWCTQCYAPAGQAAPAGKTPAPAVPEPAGDDSTAHWPCSACAADNPLAADLCRTCGAAFLAGARDRGPLLVLPVVGDLAELSQGRRTACAVAVVLGVVVLCALLGLLLA